MAASMNSEWRRKIKRKVVQRNDHRCWLCGTRRSIRTFTLDHVIPQRFGGRNLQENLKPACDACNSERGRAVDRLMTPGWYKKPVNRIKLIVGRLGLSDPHYRKGHGYR